MALLPTIRLPDLQVIRAIVDKEGRANPEFLTWLNGQNRNIRSALLAIVEFLEDIVELNDLITAANTAIENVNNAAEAITDQNALINSWPEGVTIAASDAGTDVTITISAHDRVYPQPDGTNVTVPVNGGSITGLAYSTFYVIFYDDPARAGGAVTYQASTVGNDAAQAGDRHSVGSVTTPAAAAPPSGGRSVVPRGVVEAEP